MASSRTEIKTEHASVDQRAPHKEDSGSETQSNAPNIGKGFCYLEIWHNYSGTARRVK